MTSPSRPAEFKPELYDEIAPGYYDEVYARGKGLQWFWHHHRFVAVLEPLPASGESILDMGCGPGTFLGHFARQFRNRLGIDLARPQIEYATRKYGDENRRYEACDVGSFVERKQFDAVVSIEVIEHLPREETATFLRTIFDILTPGGTVVLTTPNYRSFWPLVERIISAIGPVDYVTQHINPFSLSRLVRELEAAGFEVRSRRTIYVLAPFLAAISRRLAELALRVEQRLLPWFGMEIIVSATRPKA